MPLISSPIAYPRTSSPVYESPRKKRKLEETRDPLVVLPTNGAPIKRAGFLFDDSDEEDSSDITCDVEPAVADAALDLENRQDNAREKDYQEDDIVARRVVETQESNSEAGHERYAEISAELYQKPILGVRPTHTTRTCSGKVHNIRRRPKHTNVHYQQLAAEKSQIQANRAQKEYYGVDVHRLMEVIAAEDERNEKTIPEHDVQREAVARSIEGGSVAPTTNNPTLLWTEKYRARKFTDLVGDERTHRSVLHWLKSWDTIVFPHAARPRLSKKAKLRAEDDSMPQKMRKVLILTGPPGLGKTTLAHVCAKQAGYEVQEINASDERSRDVVKGRIRDMVCTENVKAIGASANGKATRPVCVVVDEVDGVVGGSAGGGGGGGGGEGGFVKALLDLLVLDQKNTKLHNTKKTFAETKSKKRSGDSFRLLRPLILICNDLYHPSLRLLRQSNMAEIVYIRKPALNMIIPRMQSIFEKENIPCDPDGVRQLCEVTWGVSSRKEDRSTGGAGEGDMRSVLVVGEWVATKFKSQQTKSDSGPVPARLTKRWLEEHILNDLAQGGGAARGLGRGSSKEVVERVFSYNAGFPVHASNTKSDTSEKISAKTGSSEVKQRAMQRLQEMVQSSGEDDRIMTDCFTTYAGTPFQDDPLLTKPTTATDRWLHFHDTLSTLVYSSAQEWGLATYLSTSILAFHHLFAATSKHAYASSSNNNSTADASDSADAKTSLAGPRAPTTAAELTRTNLATLRDLQSSLSIPLHRAFRSPADLSMDLLPYLVRILNPDIKPVVVGGSGGHSGVVGTASVRRAPEKARVTRAVEAMVACGVKFEQGRVEDVVDVGPAMPMSGVTTNDGRIYRMNPALDALSVFETATGGGLEKVRFAVRQVLDQEYGRDATRRDHEARAARMQTPGGVADAHETHNSDQDKNNLAAVVATTSSSTALKRDFFGRSVASLASSSLTASADHAGPVRGAPQSEGRIWVTYHEGFSNAVKKPITMKELMEGM